MIVLMFLGLGVLIFIFGFYICPSESIERKYTQNCNGKHSFKLYLACVIYFVGVVTIVFAFISPILIDFGRVRVLDSKWDIIALQDNHSIEENGHYVQINSTQDITLALGTTEAYNIYHIDSGNCTIHESNYKPHIEKFIYEFPQDKWYSWISWGLKQHWYGYAEYDIYVPSGTLTQEYKIDLR